MTNDTDTTSSTAPPVVVHNEDGTFTLNTPFSTDPRTFSPLPGLTWEQQRAVTYLVHLRVMQESQLQQLHTARIDLNTAVREAWGEERIAERRRWLDQVTTRAAAFKVAGDAIDALLRGDR